MILVSLMMTLFWEKNASFQYMNLWFHAQLVHKNLGWFLVLLLVQPKCQGEMSFIQVDLYAQDRLCLEPLQYESENLQ